MWKKALGLVVATSLLPSTAYAGDLRESMDAAVRAAANQAAQQKTQMSPTFKWIGIGLMVEGGLVAAAPCTFLALGSDCKLVDAESAGRVAGAVMAGAGALVFWIGTKKRVPVDESLTFAPRGKNGWIVQKRVKF